MIRERHDAISYLILRLAGLYDGHACVPALANQVAGIFERDLQHLDSGETSVGRLRLE